MGAVIREWSDDVRLGIIRECSPWSRVTGLSGCLSRVRGRTKEACSRSESEGPMLMVVCVKVQLSWDDSI